MPAGLFKGQQAQDVAAYVGEVAGRPGVDTGALASAGGVTGTTPADGKAVFTGVGGCGSCHTLAAAGTTGVEGRISMSGCARTARCRHRRRFVARRFRMCIHKRSPIRMPTSRPGTTRV